MAIVYDDGKRLRLIYQYRPKEGTKRGSPKQITFNIASTGATINKRIKQKFYERNPLLGGLLNWPVIRKGVDDGLKSIRNVIKPGCEKKLEEAVFQISEQRKAAYRDKLSKRGREYVYRFEDNLKNVEYMADFLTWKEPYIGWWQSYWGKEHTKKRIRIIIKNLKKLLSQ